MAITGPGPGPGLADGADPSSAVPFAPQKPGGGGGSGGYWRLAAFVASVALVAVYVSYYYRAPRTITILQATLGDFRLEMLQEKQPVVLQERVADMAALQAAWFPRTRRLARSPAIAPPPPPNSPGEWQTNPYKILMIQPTPESGAQEVFLYRAPSSAPLRRGAAPPPDATLVGIRLEPRQTLMLPHRIAFAIHPAALPAAEGAAPPPPAPPAPPATIGVHDYVTYFLPSP